MSPIDSTSGSVTDYLVVGMTCGHCVASVIEEVSQIVGVDAVTVDLVAGGVSTVHVTSASAPNLTDIRVAIDEAGYALHDSAQTGSAA